MHLHLLCKLQVNNKASYHPLQEANEATCNLNKNDAALAYLFSLDIIIIEEIGLLNSELYSTLEIISQHIMDNNNRSGGKLILCNGDPFQLTNISGSSFWLSNHLLFNFDVALLQHYVRSATDPILQKILQLLRKSSKLDQNEREYIINNILNLCAFINE